jgi:hypothetical protein
VSAASSAWAFCSGSSGSCGSAMAMIQPSASATTST